MQSNQRDQAAIEHLERLSQLIRHWVLSMSGHAGSGHPTSAMSATELMVDLFFGGVFRHRTDQPDHPNNDRLIFSKGHASPLLYALWAAAGQVPEDQLQTYRDFGSPLEGHPTWRFPLAEAATGSLGQGLSVGVGLALAAKRLDRLPYRTYVLLGDSEMAEGSQWEAIQIAAHYKLDNLVGILDVNRLGQRGETMYGHDLQAYQQRIAAFGWETLVVDDGHDHGQVLDAYRRATAVSGRPVMVIARTVKGKGVSLLEDEGGWHGKALDGEKLQQALQEIGPVDHGLRGTLAEPDDRRTSPATAQQAEALHYERGDEVATRQAYGQALQRLGKQFPAVVALDGEVSNSTKADLFAKEFPDRFFEMFIAEQNMVGTALGMALCGKQPFVSTFAAFLTRAFDQIRMLPHSDANVKFVGSHAGVSIGPDGPSQMGLEDLGMFRTLPDSVVLYPCDAVATERLVEAMARHEGIAYLRTTRGETPVIYSSEEAFAIGGSKRLRHSDHDVLTVVTAGITVHEALQAYQQLRDEGTVIRVIDLYSVKPLDVETLRAAAEETGQLLTVEDHYAEGGLGEAVAAALASAPVPIHCLAVRKRPRSGKPDQLLDDHGISARAIVGAVRSLIANRQSVGS